MGWTFTHREKGEASHLEWFANLWNGSDRRLLDMAAGNLSTLFGAYEIDANETEPRKVVALVVLIKWVPSDWYNFGYKDMDESMGPFEYECPSRILDLLTPLDEDDPRMQYAREWREMAHKAQQRREVARSVTPGDTVRFYPPMKFTDGVEADTFEYVGGRRGRSTFLRRGVFGLNGKVNISNWRRRQFEILERRAATPL